MAAPIMVSTRISTGPAGPAGPAGPPGAAGSAGVAICFIHPALM